MAEGTRILDLGMVTALSNDGDRVLVLTENESSDADAQAARDALGVTGSANFAAGNGLMNLKVAASHPSLTGVLCIGDSFNLEYLAGLEVGGHVRGAIRTLPVTGAGDSGVTVHQVSSSNADYTKSLDGLYYEIASGGNLTCGHLQRALGGPANQLHYTLFPGTGTATFEYSYAGAAWSSVGLTGNVIDTTTITGVQCGTITLPNGYGINVRCRVVASSGVVNGFIGQSLTGPGILLASFAYTGQSMAQTMRVGETIWKAMLTAFGTKLVISSWADGRFVDAISSGSVDAVGSDNFTDGGPFDRAYAWSKEVDSTIDWLFVGPHQVDPTHVHTTGNPTSDATLAAAYDAVGVSNLWDARTVYSIPFLRDFALSRGEGFVDCHSLFRSWDEANELGLYADEVHLTSKGKAYKQEFVWQMSGLHAVFGRCHHAAGLVLGNSAAINGTANFGQGAGVGLYHKDSGLPLPIFAAGLYAVDPNYPDHAGACLLGTGSGMTLNNFLAGSLFPQVTITSGGMRPITTNVGDLGTTALRWNTTWTNNLIVTTATPASASATGTAGMIAWDSFYIYVCTATNTWKRVAIATW